MARIVDIQLSFKVERKSANVNSAAGKETIDHYMVKRGDR